MRSFRVFVCALAVVALAACGGAAVTPPAFDTGTRAPSSMLWVAYGDQINVFPANGDGPVTPERSTGLIWWSNSPDPIPGIVDVAVAQDGTRWVLEKRDAPMGGPGWHLFALAPGASQPKSTYGDNVASPLGVRLGRAGILVGYYDASGTTTIATYSYAATNAPPIRTFQLTGTVTGFSEGTDGNLYVVRPTSVDVFGPASAGCCPLRSFAISRPHITTTAFGPDNSIASIDLPGNHVMYVNVYAADTGTLARRIGPLPADYNGFALPVVAVDPNNRLYVATMKQIYVFGPNANGTDNPEHVMSDPTPARPVSMSFGPKL